MQKELLFDICKKMVYLTVKIEDRWAAIIPLVCGFTQKLFNQLSCKTGKDGQDAQTNLMEGWREELVDIEGS